ncbi:MAG: DUF4198 domain-containing protein [Phycisphaeraceae bacterium]
MLVFAPLALAHDVWVQSNTRMLHAGNMVHLDLMLGNHGNNHRDFKITGKAPLEEATFSVTTPDGESYDLLRTLTDLGYTPAEGYWTTRFVTSEPGTYIVSYTVDRVVHYAPKRTIKSAKTLFVASRSLDEAGQRFDGHDKVLGHRFEIVPIYNPVIPAGPGIDMKVQVLFDGKPLANQRISFIPRGTKLDEDFDKDYERMTDEDGYANFNPAFGNYYLIAAHKETDESGDGYDSTAYSATLTVQIPHACPCCG